MATGLLAMSCVLLVACGTSEATSFTVDNGGRVAAMPQESKSGSAGVAIDHPMAAGKSQGGASGGGNSVATGSTAPTGGTATKPLRMVFVYDRSGSMGDDQNNSPPGWQNSTTRWIPMEQGMVDFLKSAPPTLETSITFFPAIGAGTKLQVCQGNYTDPLVPLTIDTQRIIDAITKAQPGGATPTLSALSGAVGYAQRVREDDPSIPIMIVLVTDGEPGFYNSATGQTETDCAPLGSPYTNTIGDIESFLRSRPDTSIPVHVLGIGEAQWEMTTIATAGGGKFVYLNDPTTFAKSLRDLIK